MAPHSDANIAKGTVGQDPMEAVKKFAGLASDSREVKPGYLFAALPGRKADGSAYVEDAVRRGAIAVLGPPGIALQVAALGVKFIAAENPRLALARTAAAFFVDQPATVAAVTGTNGKTSVTVFLREIWKALGLRAASMGTIGVVLPRGEIKLNHTTPEPVELHRLLADLKHDDIDRLAVEASSHGLDQYRLDGVDIAAAAFTNITRDHMDYHPTFEAYLACKLRLFRMVRDGGVAVVNADTDHADAFVAAAKARSLALLTVGGKGEGVRLLARAPRGDGQSLRVEHGGTSYEVELPLAGAFQASNALVAAALAVGLGEDPGAVFAALEGLKGAPGRLEKVAYAKSGAPVYVDYAHTPDALENVLTALRPHTKGVLTVVFGCGGDRDKGKRPLMGATAAKFADRVIVTDDNPRGEDAAAIRKEALAGCPSADEIADRAQAIQAGLAALDAGDVLVIAGKGHETGQIVGGVVHPFSDREAAVAAAVLEGGRPRGAVAMSALWTSADAESATLGRASRPFAAGGISIDTRTLKEGDLYVAIKGDNRDGHDFAAAALAAKASAALVSRRPEGIGPDAPLLTVANTQRALEDLGRAARARSDAKIVAVTGSAGKTTTKEMLKLAYGALGPTHVSGASFNNHWGVPLSLAALPREAAFGVFEIGMNHFGEIRSLVSFVRPHAALVVTIAPAHLEFFGTCDAIADAKSEIFEGIEPGGAAVIPADNPCTGRLAARAKQAHVARILSFGEKGDARLLSYDESGEGARVKADILGRPVDFRLGAPGLHLASNALGALLCVAATEGDVLNAAAALKGFSALKGRGARFVAGGVAVIDESYNANPTSMAAALALLGQAKGRRVAVLGDMLELGADAPALHAGLAEAIETARADLVFLCGPLMRALWNALPAQRRAVYAPSSAELAAGLMSALRAGDTVLVKGSNGSRMSVIVDALKTRAA